VGSVNTSLFTVVPISGRCSQEGSVSQAVNMTKKLLRRLNATMTSGQREISAVRSILNIVSIADSSNSWVIGADGLRNVSVPCARSFFLGDH
jgi:hypothetical protein